MVMVLEQIGWGCSCSGTEVGCGLVSGLKHIDALIKFMWSESNCLKAGGISEVVGYGVFGISS